MATVPKQFKIKSNQIKSAHGSNLLEYTGFIKLTPNFAMKNIVSNNNLALIHFSSTMHVDTNGQMFAADSHDFPLVNLTMETIFHALLS